MSPRETTRNEPTVPETGRAERPLIMGIVNVTPDSFSDGGRFLAPSDALAHARRLIDGGADILDIGGESTRPGSQPVPPEKQWERIGPVIRELATCGVPVSVDTTSAWVARRALDCGVQIINDISAGRHDAAMLRTVQTYGAELVLMHMQGEPQSMQANPQYGNCTQEVRDFLLQRAAAAEAEGIERARIWIDPGIGFGKNLSHNLELLRNLGAFVATGYKVLLGASRKSFVKMLFDAEADRRLGGSLAALVPAFESGVHCVRVHDVEESYQFLELLRRLRSA